MIFIRRARELGFSIAQVCELLALSDQADKPCIDVDQLVKAQIEVINRKIADLTVLREELDHLLSTCKGERIDECRVVQSLGRR